MRVTVSIDNEALQDLLQITHAKKKAAAISQAIESYLREQKINLLLNLRGKLKIKDNLKDIKKSELKKLAKLARSR